MKRTIVAATILIAGVGAAYALIHYANMTTLGIIVGILSIAWAYMWHLEEIKITSWHYRVVNKYFEEDLKGVCKACPYWGLVTLSSIFFIVEYGAKIIYGTILQLLVRIWQTIGWLFGVEPCWRNLAYRMAHGKNYVFYHHGKDKGDKAGKVVWFHFWPIFMLGPALAVVLFLNLGTHEVLNFYGSTAWCYDLLVTYGVMVVAVEIAEAWRRWVWQPFVWPAMTRSVRWSYRKSCPDIKFVQPAAEPAQPSLPPGTVEG